MEVEYGNGRTKYGPGVSIDLSGDEVATAIDAWLVSQGVCVRGSSTITINGELCKNGYVYVDPSGFVVSGGKKFLGRGANQALDSDTKRSYSGNPDNNPRKNIDIFHAPMF